ncbi:MAG: amidase, partial [Bacteroidetes bacterium]|nr:amidase [Bacteroidota bacterium]
MDRRKFLRNGSLASLGIAAMNVATPDTPKANDFELNEATIDQLQQKMAGGHLSSKSLTK